MGAIPGSRMTLIDQKLRVAWHAFTLAKQAGKDDFDALSAAINPDTEDQASARDHAMSIARAAIAAATPGDGMLREALEEIEREASAEHVAYRATLDGIAKIARTALEGTPLRARASQEGEG